MTEPAAVPRRRIGCLGVIGIIVGVVVLVVVVSLIVSAATRLSDADKAARCPDVTRDLIEAQLGELSSFTVTERSDYSVEGEAVVRGATYWWGCGPGITRGNRVQVDVRDSEQSSVILEYVDL